MPLTLQPKYHPIAPSVLPVGSRTTLLGLLHRGYMLLFLKEAKEAK